MRKQHVLFAALAAAVALSASGCKSREKIDLDTLHTSEAETMASTEAPGGDKEKETEKETQKETEKETETKETETRTSAAADPSKPVLKLKQKKIEIKVGDAFDAVSQVSEITDDTDDRSALFRQIEVHGDYSMDEPGTYTLTYTAMDSDGNVSAPVTLELVVKG